ncbi:ABC transporter ATP-binding protein [Pseudomonas sp. zbq_4]|uniref:ABC transporter ATP-binding protein n=1 Tax=Pseudomonas TaxID=286 RepID=UPI003709CD48
MFLGILVKLVDVSDPARLRAGLAWLFEFVRPRIYSVGGLLILSIIASALALAQPWLVKQLIDEGILRKDFTHLMQTAICMFAIAVLSSALTGVSRYFHTSLSGDILFDLRKSIYSHLQKMSPSFYVKRRLGDIVSRIDGDVSEIQRFSIDALFTAVSSVVGLIGAICFMLILSWPLTLLLCVLVPFEILWLSYMRKKVAANTALLRERSADVSSYLVEKLPAMKFVQSCVKEEAEIEQYSSLGQRYMYQLLRLQVIEFVTRALPVTVISFSKMLVFVVGGYWVITGQWQLGALIAFTTYLGMAVGPVQSMMGLYVAIQRMAVSLDRVLELKGEPVLVSDIQAPDDLKHHTGDLICDDVWFRYPGQDNYVLRNINFNIESGSKVAFVGASGSGKTTLTDLLLRFYDPDGGRIFLGGIDLRNISIASLRKKIAIVSQDIVLFKGTLQENISYSSSCSSLTDIRLACDRAKLTDWIDSLPEGLNTHMGERGQRLSGGQKQRLAIARALLQQPEILILDEATSAVDEHTEREILEEIDLLFTGKTRIVISHRKSTLKGCAKKFLFCNGEVEVLKLEA